MKSLFSLLLIVGLSAAQPLGQAAPHLFVVNKAADSVSVVNATTPRVESTIAVGRNPHELAVAPNGLKLYVPDVADNSVSVIDLRTYSHTKEILHPNFNSPHGVAFTPDSQRVLVTSEGSHKIFVLDAASDLILRVIETPESGTHMATTNKAGTWAYFTNRESNTVSFMDLSNYRIVANVPVGRGAEGFALSPDEKEIWVGNRSDATISVINVARRNAIAKLPAGSNPIRLAFAPDGKHVLVSDSASGNVDVYDVQTRKKIQSVAVGSNPGGVVVSSDGKRAFVACQGANEIRVIDMQTWKVTDKIAVGENPDGLAYQ